MNRWLGRWYLRLSRGWYLWVDPNKTDTPLEAYHDSCYPVLAGGIIYYYTTTQTRRKLPELLVPKTVLYIKTLS